MKSLLKQLFIIIFTTTYLYPAAKITVESENDIEENIEIDWNKKLIASIIEADLDKFKLALEKKASVETTDKDKSALSLACKMHNHEILSLLLKLGAKRETAVDEFNNLLDVIHANEKLGNTDDLLKLYKLALLGLEYDINTVNYFDKVTGYTIANNHYDHEFFSKSSIFYTYTKLIKNAIRLNEDSPENANQLVVINYQSEPYTKNTKLKNIIARFKVGPDKMLFVWAIPFFISIFLCYFTRESGSIIPFALCCLTMTPLPPLFGYLFLLDTAIESNTTRTNYSDISKYLNQQDNFGMSALMWLIVRNKIHSFNRLIKLHEENNVIPDLDITNINNETPVMLAAKHNRKEMLEFLSKYLKNFNDQLESTKLPEAINALIHKYVYGIRPIIKDSSSMKKTKISRRITIE